MKKVLVTGSNGLLGQKLIEALIQNDNTHVIACSKGENRLKEKNGYHYESLDITKKNEVEQVFKKHMPDVVINTAAMTNVDACESDKEGCYAVNVEAVKHMTEALENLFDQSNNPNKAIPHFIHLSTDFIFDGEAGPYKEDDKPNPISYYGWSKLEAEKIVQLSKVNWSIIRTIIVYGVVNDMSRSNVVLWAKEALEKRQSIKVVDDQFRSPTLAEDLAQGCILATMKGANGIFNISGKETMSILELVNKVADFYNLDKSLITPVKSNTLNQPAKRPPRTGFILDKAKRELGYEPHSFEEGLKIVTKQLENLIPISRK
jgi:dTDP-4-dehydrorhamnose reductase